jgi:hypothetical protein
MGLVRSNYSVKTTQNTPNLLNNKVVVDKLAAVGSFIFVRGGSLYEAAKDLGVEVKTG